ncbi:MAG TPA: glycosyltransferase [Chryseosolibacter sp.]|nr:glycosyltransferase [Chryseosolibacter sp.]
MNGSHFCTVSVIVPNFNHGAFLNERINSILEQKFQDFEIVLLDDCSSDGSEKIIEKYRNHPKVSGIVVNKRNSGSVFRQWEKGISLAKGEFIWIAESDDVADPDFLVTTYEVLRRDNLICFAYTDSYQINGNGECAADTLADVRNRLFQTDKWSSSYIVDGLGELQDILAYHCSVNNVSSVLFRAKALRAAMPFDPRLRYIGDWHCYIKLCKLGKLAYINRPLNYYRQHDSNSSRHLWRASEFILEYFVLFNWLQKELPSLPKKKLKRALVGYIQHTPFRNISVQRFKLYLKLARINFRLLAAIWCKNIAIALRFKLSGKRFHP